MLPQPVRDRGLILVCPSWFNGFSSGTRGGGAENGPALDGLPVAGLPVSVFGFQEKARIDGEMQGGLILKANVNGVGLAGGEELDVVHDLAFHLFHAVDRAAGITADGGFASADDDRRREFHPLRPRDVASAFRRDHRSAHGEAVGKDRKMDQSAFRPGTPVRAIFVHWRWRKSPESER